MSYTTIQQLSDALALHSVRIDAAQGDADFAQTEAARALTSIYDTGLAAEVYTDFEIQKLKDALRVEFQAADDAKLAELIASISGQISAQLPGHLNGYYGPYSDMQALYDALIGRFDLSDAALDHLLNTVFPGLQSNFDTLSLTASTVAQDFDALQDSLKSVLVVFAADAIGTDQSLTAGDREYVQYVEYNITPPTLPVTGSFVKFVGTGQSIWPIYASDAAGNNQSFEPAGRDFVTFYENPVAPDLPVSGVTFVPYVGQDGPRGAGSWWIPVTTLPTTSVEAQDAWIAATVVPDEPKIQDQAWFYTGDVGNPTGQAVFICQFVSDVNNHGWDYQEHVMRGDLLVTGTVTADQIDSKGLSIRDQFGNIILQATGGSAGLTWDKVLAGAGRPEDNANYVTGTNQLTDNAALGQTANWGNVSGSGKPQDYADVTGSNKSLGTNGGNVQVNHGSAPSAVAILGSQSGYYGVNVYHNTPGNGAIGAVSPGGFTGQFTNTVNGSGGFGSFCGISGATNGGGSAKLGSSTWGLEVISGGAKVPGGVTPFTGQHDAMMLRTASYEIGDIVCETDFVEVQIAESFAEVVLSSTPVQKNALGVLYRVKDQWEIPASFVDQPATVAFHAMHVRTPENPMAPVITTRDIADYENDYFYVFVNALGEGSINVCGENGNIQAGDLIVTSSIVGKGMRQSDDIVRSTTVARARQDMTFTGPTEVKMVACIYMCG